MARDRLIGVSYRSYDGLGRLLEVHRETPFSIAGKKTASHRLEMTEYHASIDGCADRGRPGRNLPGTYQ